MTNKKIVGLFLFFIFSSFFFSLCFAQLEYPLPGAPPKVTGKEEFKKYFEAFLRFVLAVAGLILFSILVYGGFLYLISAGDPNKKAEGKKKIAQGFVGIALLLLLFLFYKALWGKEGLPIPSSVTWPQGEITSGVWMTPENVGENEYLNILKQGFRLPEHARGESSLKEGQKLVNVPSKKGKTEVYDNAFFVAEKAEKRRLGAIEVLEKDIYYLLGKENKLKIVPFQKGSASGPGPYFTLEKSSASSGAGINLCACSAVFEAPTGKISEKTCIEWLKQYKKVKEIPGSVCKEIPLNGDYQVLRPPKEGIFDYSKDSRTISVNEGISAIICAQNGECVFLEGPIAITNISQLPQDFWDVVFLEGSQLAIPESKISKIYLFRGK